MSSEIDWLPAEFDDDALIDGLEPDQLAVRAAVPVGRATFGRRAVLGLWALRVFALLVSGLVLYTFVYDTIH